MKVGIIGLGSIGQRHARNLLSLGHHVLGFDPSTEGQNSLIKLGGEIAENEDGVFSQSDSIIIASPNKFHFKHLEKTVSNRIPALVEKPLAHTMSGLSELLDQAERSSTAICVAMNLRFHPVVKHVHDILEKNKYGRVIWGRFTMSSYLPAWRPHQDYRIGYTADKDGGGIMLDNIHETDLATHLLGRAKVVCASAHNSGLLDIPTEDCADIVLEHDNNIRSSIHMDYVSKNRRRFFEIQCEHALIVGDLNKRSVEITTTDDGHMEKIEFGGSYDDDYVDEMRAFLDHLQKKSQYPCLAADSYSTLENILKAREMAGIGA